MLIFLFTKEITAKVFFNQKYALRVVRTLLVLLSAIFFIGYAIENYQNIPELTWNLSSVAAVAATTISWVFVIVLGGTVWFVLLRDYSVMTDWRTIQVVFSISQFSKYLPGNVGHHVGRVVMAKELGISYPITLQTLFVETAWSLAVGACLSLVSLLFFVKPEWIAGHNVSGLYIAYIIPVALFLPWLSIRFVNRFFPGLVKRLVRGEQLMLPTVSSLIKVTSILFLNFLIMGVIIDIQAYWLFGVAEGDIAAFTCIFAVAWFVGYVTPGAPAGLGIRDVLMVLLLTPILGAGTAVGLSITLRITTTLGDLLAFVMGLLGQKYARSV